MFLLKTYEFCRGYSEIQIEGFFVERFVNLCSIRGIKIWDIDKKTEGIINLKISESDLGRIDELLKITRSQMRIVKKIGIPNITNLYKKRKFFILISFVSCVVIYFLSLHIWDIEIVGNEKISTEEIEKILNEEDVRIGRRKDSIDFEKIKNDIYINRKDVLWIGVTLKGVKVTIEILERKNVDEDSLENSPTNIIADRDGVIQKISVRAGQKCVEEGDVVCKGDILVSGVVESEHSDPVMVNSNADVKIKTWYTSKKAVPYQKTILSKSGKVDKKYKIKLGNYTINLANNSTKFEKYDTINSVKKLVLFDKIETPISLDVLAYEELIASDITYTQEQAEKIAKKEVYDLVMKNIPDDAEVLNYDYNVFSEEDEIIVRITVECLENIGVEEKISF